MLISGRASRGCSPAGGEGSQVPLLPLGAVYRHWGCWQPLPQPTASREGAQQGVKPCAEPVELARRAEKRRSERLRDGGGDAGRAQGCWSLGQEGERGWGTSSPGHSSHWFRMTLLLLDTLGGLLDPPFPPDPTSPGQLPHSPVHPGSCECWVLSPPSRASLSLVFSHCYPWHPCPGYPWHSSPPCPHPCIPHLGVPTPRV